MPPQLEAPTEDMDEIENRDKHICWKIKGIAAKVTYRMFSKYGNPKFVEEKMLPFSKAFKEKYALALFESHLGTTLKRKNCFVGSKAINFAIKFISQSTKMPFTMDKLKPFVVQLLTEVVVTPLMLITHKDITLFKEDSIEYVRKQQDFSETLFAPKNTAIDFLTYAIQYRSSKKVKVPDYLTGFLQYCAHTLHQYQQATNAGQAIDWRIKEAILYAIGSILEDIQP